MSFKVIVKFCILGKFSELFYLFIKLFFFAIKTIFVCVNYVYYCCRSQNWNASLNNQKCVFKLIYPQFKKCEIDTNEAVWEFRVHIFNRFQGKTNKISKVCDYNEI